MPRYYFDADDHRDLLGADLPDDRAARHYALRLAGDLIRDLAAVDPAPRHWRLDLCDADRRPLAALTLALHQSD